MQNMDMREYELPRLEIPRGLSIEDALTDLIVIAYQRDGRTILEFASRPDDADDRRVDLENSGIEVQEWKSPCFKLYPEADSSFIQRCISIMTSEYIKNGKDIGKKLREYCSTANAWGAGVGETMNDMQWATVIYSYLDYGDVGSAKRWTRETFWNYEHSEANEVPELAEFLAACFPSES